MTDLVEWLTSVWDEDEALARKAEGGVGESYIDNYGHLNVPRHQVLARIAADRKILRLHGGMAGGGAHECPDGFLDGAQTEPHTGCEVECETLRLMASAYADRPGFRDEWRV